MYRSEATDAGGRFALGELPAGSYGLSIETAEGGGFLEAYGIEEDQPLESYRDTSLEPKAPPPPLRQPKLRSIAEAGGRHWKQTYRGLGGPPVSGAQPPPEKS